MGSEVTGQDDATPRAGTPARVNDPAVSGTVVMPTSAAALERAIEERRVHLAATIDELAARAKPKEIARRTGVGVQQKVRTLTHGDDGQLRIERLAAAGGGLAVLLGLLLALRRRAARASAGSR